MIGKIRSSLFAKVFLLTIALLMAISFFVYGILFWIMPKTYLNELSEALDDKAQSFLAQLEQVRMEESGGLFDGFLQNDGISYIRLYTEKGSEVKVPTNQEAKSSAEEMSIAVTESTEAWMEDAPMVSNSYYFSFLDEKERYMLFVYGDGAKALELERSFGKALPALLFMVTFAALAVGWLYSHMITKPVLKISGIAREMSLHKLDWQLEGKRSDELGVLEKSLNQLSKNLSTALSGLQDANRKLEKDMEQEKELEQARLQFFSAASHELKTPITIMKGQLEGMLLLVGVYKNREKYLSRSLEIANRLETMVQEILTVSRLETESAAFQKESFDCIPLLFQYFNETEDFIARKGLDLQLALPENVYIYGNQRFMEMVFSNLIGNAIRYCPEGGTVFLSLVQEKEEVVFSVENTGERILEENLPKLFDAFYRVEESHNRETGGSGLGLYIVQKILNRHGTHCSVCNTEMGVKFSFHLSCLK